MVKRVLRWFSAPLSDWIVPLLFLGVSALAYGLLFIWQGYYWDDYPLTWIAHTYGTEGLARYFSTNRPLWGLLYQVSNTLLGESAWQWQLFGLFWRWLSAVLLWLVVHRTWPRQSFAAVLAGLACLVYPGFGQQLIGLVYGHFFLVLCAFFFSLYASLRVLEGGKIVWLAGALLTSLVSLVTLEYFFLLELVRPLLFLFSTAISGQSTRERIKKALASWLPYLALFIATGLWRFFLFPYQTNNYQPIVIQTIRENPLAGLLQLASTWLSETWTAGIAAWSKAYTLPNATLLGSLNFALYLLALVGGLFILLALLTKSKSTVNNNRAQQTKSGIAIAGCGLFALLIAGWPFFLTGLPVALGFPNDRFTLPFILGSSLLLAGIITVLPVKHWLRVVFAVVLIVPSIGYHFLNATEYRRDWNLQKSFFWQLSWRAPGLEPGTTLFTNDLPVKYFSDNSLTAPLNWIYAPENKSQEMSYMLFYPAVRLGRSELPSLQKGLPIEVDYLAAAFHGNTNQVVVIYYQPPGCLRVIDGVVELDNFAVPVGVREAAAKLGSREWIFPEPVQPAVLPSALYGAEPAHGWCYYYEKADLARQQEDWELVASLGDTAFALDDYPNDPAERLPFIEGYAHVGRWEQAVELSRETADISPVMNPVLCSLWQRIERTTPPGDQKDQTLMSIQDKFGCISE